MEAPIVSIVAVGRNDNYGGDFRTRLQSFVNWTFRHLSEHQIPSELIFLNYNPLEELTIEEFIEWPASTEVVKVRIITVSQAIHAQIVQEKGVKDIPVLEYLAKNAGIRRAKGQFILSMNPDILISESIFDSFKHLSRQCYYRANRVDFSDGPEVDLSNGSLSSLHPRALAIWFKGMSFQIKGFNFFKYAKYHFYSEFINRWRVFTMHLRPVLDFLSIPVYYDNIEYRIHCNASGDFMLMHQSRWNDLRGYDESSYIALHVDSVMVINASYSGLVEKTFWRPIYHKDHERRFDAVLKNSEDQQAAYKRFRQDVESMISSGRPIIRNDSNWGLNNHELTEQIL